MNINKYKPQKEYAKRKELVKIGVDMPRAIRNQFKQICIKNKTTYSKVLKDYINHYIRSTGTENLIKILKIEEKGNFDKTIFLENGIILMPSCWTGEYYTNGFNPKTDIFNHYRYIPIYDCDNPDKLLGYEETI